MKNQSTYMPLPTATSKDPAPAASATTDQWSNKTRSDNVRKFDCYRHASTNGAHQNPFNVVMQTLRCRQLPGEGTMFQIDVENL